MKRLPILLLPLLLIIQACSNVAPLESTQKDSGKILFNLDKQNAPSDVDEIVITLTRENYNNIIKSINVNETNNSQILFENIDAGTWEIIIEAFNNDQKLLYFGETEAIIIPGIIVPVNIQLSPTTGSIIINITWGTKLHDNIVAFYPFIGNANDYSGNELNGILNGPTLSKDRFGNPNSTYNFDGVNDYISLPIDFDYPQRTICLWFNFYNFTSDQGIIFTSDHPDLENSSSKILIRNVDDKAQLQYYVGGGMNDFARDSIEKNTWYFIAMSINADSAKCYLNGELIKTLPFVNHHSNSSNFLNSLIGCDRYGTGRFFNGSIDDLIIFNKSLSDKEIELLYNFSK